MKKLNDPAALLKRILGEAKRQGLTAAEMSRRTGITINTCSKVLKGESRRVSADTVCLLMEALRCSFKLTDAEGRPLDLK